MRSHLCAWHVRRRPRAASSIIGGRSARRSIDAGMTEAMLTAATSLARGAGRCRGEHHRRNGGRTARDFYVANCPGKNAIAVAELAFGLLLALDRRIPDNVAASVAALEQEGFRRRAASTVAPWVSWFRAAWRGKWRGSGRWRSAWGWWSGVRWFQREGGQPRSWHCRASGCGRAAVAGRSAERSDALSLHLARLTRRATSWAPGFWSAQARRALREHSAGGACGRWSSGRGCTDARLCASPPTSFATSRRQATADFSPASWQAAERLWHAPHWRIDRAGTGSDRRRNRPHREQLQRNGDGAERRQPRQAARRRLTGSWCGIAIGQVSSRTFSTSCVAAI